MEREREKKRTFRPGSKAGDKAASQNLVYNNVPVINDIERAAPLELLEKKEEFSTAAAASDHSISNYIFG